ncbi:S-receptor kinase-like [Panicum miliaceum]|uniref:S-receptor kinase-like n=1 Tax=Panicum miliaceum TaxID=4540 RepID=A0A3L6RHN8_PANMI|nr:S-receptor kinase-like [Panicum miliaceum]
MTPDLTSVDTRGKGTPGLRTNARSPKSDVPGMMLPELVGGRRNCEPAADASASDFTRHLFPCVVRQGSLRANAENSIDF